MDKLILADIQALAASPDYAGRGFLQSSSAVLGLSAALFVADLSLWQGSGYKLTDGEIDDIQAMVAQLEADLMLTGDMYAMDKVKATNSTHQTITHDTYMQIALDTDVYDPQDMHDPVTNNSRIYAVRDGLHLINLNIVWNASAVGYRQVLIQKWDSTVPGYVFLVSDLRYAASGSIGMVQSFAFQDEAIVDDFYLFQCKQTSGGDLSILSTTSSPIAAVVRL